MPINLSITLPAIAFVIVSAAALVRSLLGKRLVSRQICRKCRYDIDALIPKDAPGVTCPECGTIYTFSSRHNRTTAGRYLFLCPKQRNWFAIMISALAVAGGVWLVYERGRYSLTQLMKMPMAKLVGYLPEHGSINAMINDSGSADPMRVFMYRLVDPRLEETDRVLAVRYMASLLNPDDVEITGRWLDAERILELTRTHWNELEPEFVFIPDWLDRYPALLTEESPWFLHWMLNGVQEEQNLRAAVQYLQRVREASPQPVENANPHYRTAINTAMQSPIANRTRVFVPELLAVIRDPSSNQHLYEETTQRLMTDAMHDHLSFDEVIGLLRTDYAVSRQATASRHDFTLSQQYTIDLHTAVYWPVVYLGFKADDAIEHEEVRSALQALEASDRIADRTLAALFRRAATEPGTTILDQAIRASPSSSNATNIAIAILFYVPNGTDRKTYVPWLRSTLMTGNEIIRIASAELLIRKYHGIVDTGLEESVSWRELLTSAIDPDMPWLTYTMNRHMHVATPHMIDPPSQPMPAWIWNPDDPLLTP